MSEREMVMSDVTIESDVQEKREKWCPDCGSELIVEDGAQACTVCEWPDLPENLKGLVIEGPHAQGRPNGPWTFYHRGTLSSCEVDADTWYLARQEAMARLGGNVDEVDSEYHHVAKMIEKF